jgi:hypothetical protein
MSARADEVSAYVLGELEAVRRKVRPIVEGIVDCPNITSEYRFNSYPLLFSEAFPHVAEGEIKQLALAFRLGWEYVSIADPTFDTVKGATPSNLICGPLFYDRFIRELQHLFGISSKFWTHYDEYLYEHSKALLTEVIRIRYGLGVYTYDEFAHCSANKIGFGKVVIAGLAILGNYETAISPLVRSHDKFYIAAQFRDDLMDWLEDYDAKSYSFLVRRALSLHGIGPDDFVRKWPTAEEFRKMVYFSEVADWSLDQSRKAFIEAKKEAESIGVDVWSACIDEFLLSLDSLAEQLRVIRRAAQ